MAKSDIVYIGLIGLIASFIVCLIIVKTKNIHGKLTLDTTSGVQKFHTTPTPRIGGVGLIIGLYACTLASELIFKTKLSILETLIISGMPAFIIGSAEDITKKIGVKERLAATIISGIVAVWLTGVSITRLDIWGLDYIISWLPLSIAFTAFAVGGIANAINIIDGFNGLASGTLIICFTALGVICQKVGDAELAKICIILSLTTIGFLLINFPYGKIFLGDGGAYLMGFLLAWICILLPMRNSEVSVWAPLLICAHPFLEVAFSIWRKHNRDGHHPGQPDKVHLHMLMYRRIIKQHIKSDSKSLKNGLTSLTLWPLSIIGSSIAIIYFNDKIILAIAFAILITIYHLIYIRLTQFKWKITCK